ncbi:hypothetical protein D0Z00_001308 [Geotrichum galactomycetum]|uniref:Uncharacterized protein n=1 Tax=Geotrichum galactomycetum TaxID=27317 RepID=A0ACB6V7G4_9ASCO|nr:hypothetical protein D0Z00_001308 [Geotrichum candidum]
MTDDLDLSGSSHWDDVPSSSSRLNLAAEVFQYNTPLEPEFKETLHSHLETNGFEDLEDTPTDGNSHHSDSIALSKSELLETTPMNETLCGFQHHSKQSQTTPTLAEKSSSVVTSPTRKSRISTLRSSRVRKSAPIVQVESESFTDPLNFAKDDDDKSIDYDNNDINENDNNDLTLQHKVSKLSIHQKSTNKTKPSTSEEHKDDIAEEDEDKDQSSGYSFTITVGDPIKIGDLTTAHTVYTVHTVTDSPEFKRETTVIRRYRDFRWLYGILEQNNPGIIIPPPPEKQAVGRFDEDFVEARRLALSTMLNKVAKHWVLQRDEDFRIFLESETFTTDIKNKQVSDSKGIMSTIGEAFSFSSAKFVDTSEKINERKKRVDVLENQFRVLSKSLEQVVASRRELSDATTELANGLALMADVGLSSSLSELVEQFSLAQLKIRDVYYRQCLQDVLSLSTTLEEYIRLIGSIRSVFLQRQKAYFEYQALEQELNKKRVYVEKLQRQGKTQMDKIALLTEDSQEQEKRVTNALTEYERIGRVLLRELKRFEVEKAEEFRNSVELFLENSVEAQKEAIEIWETFYQVSGLRK